MNNSYTAIRDHIFHNLKKVEGVLPKDKIEEEIKIIKDILATVGYETLGKLISSGSLSPLKDSDWERMQRELETNFDVKMEAGILIQGNDQKDRDNTWWTAKTKQQLETYYWDRYKTYLSDFLPREVIRTMDLDTDVVMNNLANPTTAEFSRYGMVVGHVQSGKTGNYSGLVCKAADAGYKFIVVITGGTNNLRNQTQQRLNESFVGHTNSVPVGVGKGNMEKNQTPFSLTTILRDFNKQDADRASQNINFESISVPLLLVIKKNTTTLKSVIAWLEKQYKNNVSDHAMLIIDDESDYASVNTKEEEDPTAINLNIRKLLSLFSKSAYVAYTATPYANIFIDHQAKNEDLGLDLFPKDFIYALDAPTNYFGARKIFLDTDDKHLIEIDDADPYIPIHHKKDFEVIQLPPTLYEAIRVFILNIAIRNLRGYTNSHNSMLSHGTRFTNVHQQIASVGTSYFDELKSDTVSYGKLENPENISEKIKDVYTTYTNTFDQEEFDWHEVIKLLTDLIGTIVIREVHQKTTIPLEYRKDIITNVIAVGGASLARGYTLEGLSVSYFLRNTVFYDTLMQMGRWFGYRNGYEDLCRIYMPAEKMADFAEIILATENLMADFKLMSENGWTPNDFGLSIQENPDSALQITARNKQKHVKDFYFSMKLDGKAKETSVLSSEPADIQKNIDVVAHLIKSLSSDALINKGSYLWKDVNYEIILEFLNNFITFPVDPLGLSARMPIEFIKVFVGERKSDWDIALYNGQGDLFTITDSISIRKEKRRMTIKDNGNYELKNRQVSSGNSESISLDDNDKSKVGNDRIEARRIMRKPLLMLHILEPSFKDKSDNMPITLAAFGASFPGDALTDNETVKLKINTVYYNNLLKELDADEESDD